MNIPIKVKAHFNSAESLFNDANNLPRALKYNASRVFLLISSLELLKIASEELSNFIKTKKVESKIYRDHQLKLKDAPAITHSVAIKDQPTIQTKYIGSDIHKVRQLALFGKDSISREDLFMRGWHFDGFARRLKAKIDFLHIHISAIESLPNNHNKFTVR